MTLNITAANPWFVAQVSDRRLTCGGRLYDDEANKAVILGCRDAILLITYTGLGYVNELRTDDWIVELLLANNAARRDMGFAVEILRQAASQTFGCLPEPDKRTRHTFVVAGWREGKKRIIPYIWLVSNCQDFKSGAFGSIRDRFHSQYVRMARNTRPDAVALVVCTGMGEAVSQAEGLGLRNSMLGAMHPEVAVSAMMQIVQRVAGDPEYGRYVGRNCMTIVAPRGDEAELVCEYASPSAGRVAYTPQIVTDGMVLRASEIGGLGGWTLHGGGRRIQVRGATQQPPTGAPFATLRSQRTPPRPG